MILRAPVGLLCLAAAVAAVRAAPPRHPAGSGSADSVTIRISEGTALTFDLTPDGRYLVVDLLGQLWEIPAGGGAARALTNAVRDTADDRQPAVSPDGRWIATRSDRPRGRGLWVHSRDGMASRQRTDSSLILGDDLNGPVWSPDGARLAWTRQGAVWLGDAEAGPPAKLTPTGMSGDGLDEPHWSPDGRRLAVSGPWRGGSARALLEGPAGAPVWVVELATGTPRRITPEGVAARAPAWSPDGTSLAYFIADSGGAYRLVVQPLDSAARTVSSEAGLEPRRVRWSPDGGSLYYVAAGRLRRVATSGGAPAEVPFVAQVAVPRRGQARPGIRIPEAGTTVTARGFSGVALSPDGRTIALLALGRLWLMPASGGSPRAVASVPPFATSLAWSPEGRQVAWVAQGDSAEDLWVTEVGSGVTRQLTALPGEEARPSWSPDGQWIAFMHWPKSGSRAAPWADEGGGTFLRVVAARRSHPASSAEVRTLAEIEWGEYSAFASAPQWATDGRAVLAFGQHGWPVANRRCAEAIWFRLDSTRQPVGRFPCRPGHAVLAPDGALLAVERGLLVRHPSRPDGFADGDTLTANPALWPSVARDGAVLYLAPDGLRLRSPEGSERRLGWPLRFPVPVPPPLLVRNVRLVPLEAGADTGLRDLLIVNGNIRRVGAAGSLRQGGARELDAGGRWAIPGLIDVHGHLGDAHAPLRAALYHGVTVMREMWHPLGDAAAARDAVLAGAAAGARVVVSGPPVYPAPEGVAITTDFLWVPVDSATAKRGLALLEALGAGHLKMRYVQSWSGAAAVVEAAHRHGLRVSGHCAHALVVVAAGMDGHEHLDGQCGDWEFGIRDDLVQLYRAGGVAVTPVIDYHDEIIRTAHDTTRIHAPGREPFLTPALRLDALWPPNPAVLARVASRAARARTSTRRMSAGGVRIAAGSDAHMFPGGVTRELQALVAAGLTPREALRAATVDAAAVIGAQEQLGRLAVGRLGDLVLLDGDPLADITNVGRIHAVIQGGQVVDREALARRRHRP